MKYCVIVLDGMSDRKFNRLDNRTPLQSAKINMLDSIAKQGRMGTVKTIPDDLPAQSLVSMMSILGLDPSQYYTGNAAWEIDALGISLQENEWPFCADLICQYQGLLLDPCSGNLSTSEAIVLLKSLATHFQQTPIQFYPWKKSHHLAVIKGENFHDLTTVSPYNVMNHPLKYHYPKGKGSKFLIQLLEEAGEILEGEDVNIVRMDLFEPPANALWLWGQGKLPELRESFQDKFELHGGILSSNLAVQGFANLFGLDVVLLPDKELEISDWKESAIQALRELDIVFIHLESLTEISRKMEPSKKVLALEELDDKLISPILSELEGDYSIMVVGGYHVGADNGQSNHDAVPFAFYGTGCPGGTGLPFDEESAKSIDLSIQEGYELLPLFLRR